MWRKSAHTTVHLSSTARQKEKKNYMDYLANTPGVEKTGSHCLFSNEGETFIQVLRSITISEAGNISGYVVLKGSIERSHSSKKKML